MPVAWSNVYVPCPVIVTMPSASQAAGDDAGVMRQVAEVLNPAADVARPDVPVNVVNATVSPGLTDLPCGVATGVAGALTVGVIVAFVT